jgi:hypothetical protein
VPAVTPSTVNTTLPVSAVPATVAVATSELPYVIDVGFAESVVLVGLAGTAAVPVRGMLCCTEVPLSALSVTTTFPVMLPLAVVAGLNSTESAQDALGIRLVVEVQAVDEPLSRVKFDDIVRPVKARVELPVLTSATLWAALVDPGACVPKLKVLGVPSLIEKTRFPIVSER